MTSSEDNRNDLIRENALLRRRVEELEARLGPESTFDLDSFRAWADSASVCVFLLRLDRLIYVNAAFAALVDIPRSELLDRPCWDMVCSEDSEMVRQRLADHQAGLDLDPVFRLRVRGATGRVKWIELHETIVTIQGAPVVLGFIWDVTDWVESKRLLDAEKERYRTVVENAREAIFTVDRQGVFLFMNWETARQLGGKPPDFVGRSQWDVFPKALADRQMQAIRGVLESGEGFSREVPTVMPDGPHYHHTTGVPIRDLDGHIASVLCIARDVTDLVQARNALRESEDKYSRLLQNLPVGVFQRSADGRLLGANDALVRMYGFDSVEDCLANPDGHYVVGEDKEREIERLLAETGHLRDFEVEVKKKNGSTFWVSVNARANYDKHGELTGIDGAEVDISERKLAELKFEKMFRHNPALMALSTFPDNHFVDVNDVFLSTLGYSREEVIGKAPVDLNLFPVVDQQASEARNRLMAGGRIQDVEMQVRRKNGLVLDGLFSGEVIVSQGKQYFLTLMVDVTERRRAGEALRLQSLVLDQIKDHVTITDFDGVITYVNQAVADTHTRSKSELVGQPTTAYGEHAEIGATQREILETTLRDGVWHGEVVNYAGDGREIIMDCRTQVVHDENGRPTALCGIATDVTERKRAEQALAASELKYRHLFENAQVGMFRTTLDGSRILGANRHMAETFGYTLEEVFQRTVVDMWFDVAQRAAFVATLKEKGEIRDFEFTVRTKSGEPRTALVAARLNQGQIEGSVIDITERKRAEQALAESEQLFRALAESSPAAIVIFQDESIIYANPLLLAVLGLKESEVETMKFWELMAPEFQDKVRQIGMARQRGEEVPDSYEVRVVTPDGQSRWALFSGRRIDYKGRPAGLALAVDITERRLMEERLRESEERFRRIAERSFDAIFVCDMDGTIKYASPSIVHIGGFTPEQVVGRHISEFVVVSYMSAIGRGLALLAAGKSVENLQFEAAGIDGKSRFLEANAVPIFKDGRVVAFQAVVRDTTERRRAEELLQRSYDDQSRQLRQVAGGLAHDVYNDLFPVTVSLYRLRQRLEKSTDLEKERSLRLLSLAEGAIGRAISLTESVNLYSKMQKGKAGACADCAAVVRSVLDHNSERITRSGVRVTSSVPDTLVIGCAENQLHPMFNNLLLNALDALAGSKAPTIDITARIEEGRAVIEFSDNGCGIPADVLPRIFEPFFSTKPHTGTGLGLAIVKRIVDISGGRISVQSDLDNGTTFSILLPTDVGTSSGATH